ncbi:MAG: translation initiation factor IF-2 [Spirochaetales bacterium]|nr:translation initiation factor IF-2 [Spirochaetales bacterium]
MADEQENKQKPKATLIKHRKPAPVSEPADDEKKIEKKKVVVIKKKKPKPRVIVKSEPVPAEKAAIQPISSAEHRSGSAPRPGVERPVARDGRPGDVRTGPAQELRTGRREPVGPRSPSPRRPQQGGGQFQRGGAQARQRTDSRPPSGRPPSGRPPSGRPPSGRPSSGRPPSGRSSNQRPPAGRGGGRPTSGRPQQRQFGRSGGGQQRPSQPTAEKKPVGKKFYKSKKKSAPSWKKREQIKERDFQIKKRQIIQKANPVPKQIDIMEVITVSELAKKMNLKASELISKLMGMGMMVTINQQIDAETASLLAEEYGSKVNIVSLYDETIIETETDTDEDLSSRPPVVTVMGHVDHGKTQLLDTIRKTDVVSGEFGGITQHIGAYKVKVGNGEIVFLDTPGHEAFTLMRARGAQVTDIVILVVAANDGAMPQTVEAINHAKDAGVPLIVAVNKIDLPEANPDRVKQQLSEYNLIPEDWGGGTLFNEVSALNGTGVKELLDTVVLQSEMLELKANYDCRAEGKVIESKVDHGRGIVGTVLVQRGTLKVGDAFVAGIYPGKVRAMFDDKGNKIGQATPATPVEILGFSGIPDAGAPFQVTENEKTARQVGLKRQELEKQGEAMKVKKITLDNLYDSMQDGETQELKVIIKGDVHGSVEALQTALEKLSTEDIRLTVINAAAGAIIENDVNLAVASNAIIIGFHVRPTPKAAELAEHEKVEIRKYNIIYDAVADIEGAMEGMLSPELREQVVGRVEVRNTFKVPRIGVIAGCYVTAGQIGRGADVRIFRDGIEILSGKITSLKRFKDDARVVESGYECGLSVDNYLDVRVGDELEVYEVREVAKKLTQEGASV